MRAIFSSLSFFVVSCFLLLLNAIAVTHTLRQIAPYLRVPQNTNVDFPLQVLLHGGKKVSQTVGLVDLYYLSRHIYRETGAEAQ